MNRTGALCGGSRLMAISSPITVPERLGAVLLLGTSLVIGLYPRLLLDLIVPSFNTALFDGMRKEGCYDAL